MNVKKYNTVTEAHKDMVSLFMAGNFNVQVINYHTEKESLFAIWCVTPTGECKYVREDGSIN